MYDSKEPSIILYVKIYEVHKKSCYRVRIKNWLIRLKIVIWRLRDTNETASLGLIVAFVEVVVKVHIALVVVVHWCPVLSFFRESRCSYLVLHVPLIWRYLFVLRAVAVCCVIVPIQNMQPYLFVFDVIFRVKN